MYPKVVAGEMPGLATSGQHTNIFSDVLLTWFMQHAGVDAAQRLVLSGATLLMFWGMFAVVAALTGRVPWVVSPFLGMLTYGWAFQLGFLNSYFSTAFCFLIFALLWLHPRSADLVAAAILLAAAILAHPAGLAWAVGSLAFGWIVRTSSPPVRWAWLAAGVAALVVLSRWAVAKLAAVWYPPPWLNVTGADQFYLFRARFFWLAVAIASLWLVLVSRAAKESGWKLYLSSPVVLLYLLSCAAVFLSPVALKLPGSHSQLFGFLGDRLSLMAAVLACACIATARTTRWTRFAISVAAVFFFFFLFTDMRQLNRVEAKVDDLLRTLPAGQRVTALIYYPRGRISELHHMIGRECIGRCWAYSDYEPSSGHFRIRAAGRSPYLLTVPKDVDDVLHGRYIARNEDLPLYQIYPCGPRETDLCIRALHEGDRNGAIDLLRHY